MKNTFNKEERLCSKSLIDKLFHNGSSFVVYPFRVVYLSDVSSDRVPAVQVIISVSKRRFKHAVKRNAIKRKMREVYRLQKSAQLYPHLHHANRSLLLAIQYIGKEEVEFKLMFDKMNRLLTQLCHETNQSTGQLL